MNGRQIAAVLVAAITVGWTLSASAANDVTLVSHAAAGPATAGDNGMPDSRRRRFAVARDSGDIAFTSLATNLVAGEIDSNNSAPLGGLDVYYYDHLTGAITIVSHVAGTATMTCSAGDSRVSPGGISANGRFVAYASSCTDLISPALFSVPTEVVYLWDRTTNTNLIISATQPSPPFFTPFVGVNPQISEDGAFLYYAGDGNQLGFPQNYAPAPDPTDGILYDRVGNSYTLVTRPPGAFATTANGGTDPLHQKISADGRFVLYDCTATNLVVGQVNDGNPEPNLFLYDRTTATSQLVTHGFASLVTPDSGAVKHYEPTSSVALSANGQFVAYASDGRDLISGFVDHNGGPQADIYRYDRTTGANVLVSHRAISTLDGTDHRASNPALSDTGAFLAFQSGGFDLVTSQISTNHEAIFRWRAAGNANQMVSHDAASAVTDDNGDASNAAIDRVGNYIAYLSTGFNGVSGFVNNDPGADSFVWSASSDITQLASHVPASLVTSDNGTDAVSPVTDLPAGDVQITGLGDFVTFPSVATNLVTGQIDVNAANDYFQYLNSPLVSFQLASQSASEGAGAVGVNVLLSGPTTQAVTVPFALGGSASNPADYTITASPLVIPASATSGTIIVSIVDDGAPEPNETVVINLGVPTNGAPGALSTHTLTIVDNDSALPVVSFAVTAESVNESAGTVNISVQLSAPSAGAVTVPFTLGGTAGTPADFSAVTASPLTIPAGATTANITLNIANDTLDEPNETVVITLGTPTGATLGSQNTNTLTILDDDPPPTVSFAVAAESIGENAGSANVVVKLSAASAFAVSVPFTVSGSASAPSDYSLSSASPLTIPVGATTASITVNIVDDTLHEGPETIVFTLGGPTGATLGSPGVNTLTIVDNDAPPVLSFVTDSSTVPQGNTGTIALQLSAPSGLPVTAPFTYGGSAASPADYSATASPITIPAGANSATISLAAVNHAAPGPDQTVVISLGAATNAAVGSPSVHTVTIPGNPGPLPTVQFASVADTADESAGTISVRVQLSAASAVPVSVPYTLSGSAMTPDDYSAAPNPIVIPPGSLSADISFSIVDDGSVEGSETAVLTLGTPSNAALGVQRAHTVTIADNDAADNIANFTTQEYNVQGGDQVDVLVQLDAPATSDIEVAFQIQNLPTHYAAPDDYRFTASPLLIHAGATQALIHITTLAGGLAADADHDDNIVNCFVLVLQPTATSAPGPRDKALVNIVATRPDSVGGGALNLAWLAASLLAARLRRRAGMRPAPVRART